MARFLTACGAIPVYRKQDDPDKMDRNADAFAACFRALERGQLVGIYPEGTTHSESRVQRIKTGAARIALDYQAAGRGAPLTLIPVGITFEARKAFRGHVRVSFGEPIPLVALRARVPGRARRRRSRLSPRRSSGAWRPRSSTSAGPSGRISSAPWTRSTGAT